MFAVSSQVAAVSLRGLRVGSCFCSAINVSRLNTGS
uniref:Uncharacterized protein n=1 Tax=Anguilla anguilla TaxID=7936 RepID=A0A0E9PDK9_ANGAN